MAIAASIVPEKDRRRIVQIIHKIWMTEWHSKSISFRLNDIFIEIVMDKLQLKLSQNALHSSD